MNGVEIDMVCEDSLSALELYKRIFDVEPVEVGDYPKGQNEVVFTLYGVCLLYTSPLIQLQS